MNTNTWGLFSVNNDTFNISPYVDTLSCSRELRNIVITLLKIHNLVLDVLGYIPVVQQISGLVRMFTGTLLIITTLLLGEKDGHTGLLRDRWYNEALLTGVCQVARGALESLIPFGWVANCILDIGGTLFNLKILPQGLTTVGIQLPPPTPQRGSNIPRHQAPHTDPAYPLLFCFLDLA